MSGHLRFWRGDRFYQIAPSREGVGFIGICDGRVIATAADRADVMRAVIKTSRWRTPKLVSSKL